MKRALLLIILWVSASSAIAQGTIAFTSTPVTGALADALATGPDGSLWSVNQTANTISRVTFPDLQVSTFNVPTASAGLAGITAGPDGNMWFTESAANKIGRIDADGMIAEFPAPSGSPPPQRIFPGPNGTVWVAACPFLGVSCGSFIVQNTSGLSARLVIKTPPGLDYSADQCTLGADGNVWCFGNEESFNPFNSVFKIARIDASGGYTAFAPATGFQGSAILSAPDGNVWYTWLRAGTGTGVARVKPSGVITEFIIPTGKPQSWIFGLGLGADGNLYFADRQTSILYELVLSTATDSGTATINSGTIAIDIPEDIIAVSARTVLAGTRRAQGATNVSCPAGASFVVRSGGSGLGEIVWVTTAAETLCTDLVAFPDIERGAATFGKLNAGCYDDFFSPNPAESVQMFITLAKFDLVDALDKDPRKDLLTSLAWDNCDTTTDSSGNTVVFCTSSSIPQGKFSEVQVSGSFGLDKVTVLCLSDTPDLYPANNEYPLYPLELGVVSVPEPAPVDIRTRWFYGQAPK
jgi:streptogramin lyase